MTEYKSYTPATEKTIYSKYFKNLSAFFALCKDFQDAGVTQILEKKDPTTGKWIETTTV